MKIAMLFYYINFSSFHGDGQALWLGKNAQVIIQIAKQDQSNIYKFKLSDEEFKKISESLHKAENDSLKVNERDAIPDEVVVKFGFRSQKDVWTSLRVIDKDWGRQPKEIQNFDTLAKNIFGLASKEKPFRVEKYGPGKLKLEVPTEFLSEDIERSVR